MYNKPLIFGSGVSSFKDLPGLTEACRTAIMHGITAFDTAPSYRTEEILGQALLSVMQEKGIAREEIYIQTKIDPIQMYNGNVVAYFQNKLKAMKQEYVDALLIHWPVLEYLNSTWHELLYIRKYGYAKQIGICNLRIEHLKKLYSVGVVPDILQIERHPLNIFEEERKFCVDNDITLQDYSPLCKMHPLLRNNEMLREIALKYGKSVGQVILRWHVDTGTIPIFTSKNMSRIEEYSNIDSFVLSTEDCDKITSLNINHKLYLESLVCPGF